MTFTTLITLLAESDNSRMPVPKAILCLVFSLGIGIASLIGLFAPNSVLERFAGVIGTSNPLVARLLCGIGAVIFLFMALALVLSLLHVI
jgi:hypothetical protein